MYSVSEISGNISNFGRMSANLNDVSHLLKTLAKFRKDFIKIVQEDSEFCTFSE